MKYGKKKNGKAVIKEEKQVAKKLVRKVKKLIVIHKWKIIKFAVTGVYRNWDVIEPQLAIWTEVVRTLF